MRDLLVVKPWTEPVLDRMDPAVDRLTGVPDRSYFEAELQRVSYLVETEVAGGASYCVLIVGLDQFRTVNLVHGHKVGDRVLQQLAWRMHGVLPPAAHLARLSGDEFGIVLRAGVEETVHVWATRLMDAIRQPVRLEAREVRLTASIGVSLVVSDLSDRADGGVAGVGDSAGEAAWRNAGMAVSLAKQEGRNQVRVFKGEWKQRYTRRMELGNRLAHAVADLQMSVEERHPKFDRLKPVYEGVMKRPEFSLHFQPIVQLTNERPSGLECLLRWTSPQLGAVSPLEFVPLAEESGLIVPLGEWVLREACRQCKLWQTEHRLFLPVTVNVSPRQFKDSLLADTIESILKETGLEPAYLKLEITESMTLDIPQAIQTLLRLKRIGILIAVDDFGTSYSSLSYLKQLPIDIIKIDQSFIKPLHKHPIEKSIVQAILDLAARMKLRVVAEGVECTESMQLLRQLHCEEAQGYYFSPPVAAEHIPALLQQLAYSDEGPASEQGRGTYRIRRTGSVRE
ncbi:putative bifunctional diguanylate cyclase/phosphodiesterase [Paenibacillus koleovorans]|uniref:putative bifunctional diguanylate cyclase/phosphodiesterase n=1 Tax=Paenibacillus koleovorans TaxID=121608 RepID=UPI000FD8D862|nr:bifunctional diguanylate cyclase/phosphodiesterase [Paenibacillus koleovorans]